MKKTISVNIIADFMRQERNNGSPFTFLVGAGCSRSAGIPLANELVEEIKSCGRYNANLARLTVEQKNNYGEVMAVLDQKERQTLLGPYLEQSMVNWSHVAMACMMDAGFISRTLTFNFDSVLARACGMSSLYPATYDFVSGVTDSMAHIASPSIIHLHGQGHGLAMLNSKHETKEHALKLRPLLNDTLQKYSMLVIGYSGASDEVFPILKDAALAGNKIFWIGHGDAPSTHVRDLLEKKKELGEFHGGADSDAFLIELANELGCFPPAILSEPLQHARRAIAEIAEFPIKHTSGGHKLDILSAVRNFLDDLEGKIADQDYAKVGITLKMMQGLATEEDAQDETLDAELRSAIYFEIGKETHKEADSLISTNTEQSISLFKEAASSFKRATELAPNFQNAWNNLGVCRYEIAEATQTEADFQCAIDTYKQTFGKFPGYAHAIQNCGSAMLGLALLTNNQAHFDEARSLFLEALKITPLNSYDLACYYAVTGDEDEARKYLKTSIEAGTSPDARHMEADPDLTALHELSWFGELMREAS